MTIHTDHYGIHWDGSVAWLVQGRKGSNFVGLKGQCPFQVQGGMCNHMVPTAAPIPDRIHWQAWMRIFPDPLVQAMLPIPRGPGQTVGFVEDSDDDLGFYLATLSRLSSPVTQIVNPIWMMKAKQLEKELKTSNIQPLVLVQANLKSQALIDMIGNLALYASRPVVIVGAPELVVRPPIQRIQTKIRQFDLADLMTLPMENLGATLIRRYARREQLDAPWETREDRRQRNIKSRVYSRMAAGQIVQDA